MGVLRKRLTQIDQVLVDRVTGEVLDGHMVYFPTKIRAEGWLMAWQEGFERLATDRDMTLEALRVLHYVFARLDFENHLRLSQADIARALDMKASSVSRAMKLLLEKDILVVGDKVGRSHTYRLNTSFGWKGKVKNLRKLQTAN